MKKLIIIGASGHGKVVADIAVQNGYQEIVFLDDNEAVKSCGKYPVIGKTDEARRLDGDIIVAIGNANIRKRILESMGGMKLATLIHPAAVVANDVVIGEGTVAMAGAVVNPGAILGKGCIVNTCASIDHDCRVSDYVHVAVGGHLCGSVAVGERPWIGAGAVVSNNISVCGECMIGAGAVVVKDIKEPGTYVGAPVQKLMEKLKNSDETVGDMGRVCKLERCQLVCENSKILGGGGGDCPKTKMNVHRN